MFVIDCGVLGLCQVPRVSSRVTILHGIIHMEASFCLAGWLS
jgi:hypothetical protein